MMEPLQHDEGTKFPRSQIMREQAVACLRGYTFDALIPYQALNVAVGVDVALDRRGRRAVLQAARIVLREEHKKLVNIRTVGYRIVRSNEQTACSQHEQRRARRWLKRALETVTHVALDSLTAEEVAKVLTEQARCGLSLWFQRKITKRALPPREQMALPSGDKLIEMFRKRA